MYPWFSLPLRQRGRFPASRKVQDSRRSSRFDPLISRIGFDFALKRMLVGRLSFGFSPEERQGTFYAGGGDSDGLVHMRLFGWRSGRPHGC